MTVSTIATIAAALTRTSGSQNAGASAALTNLVQASAKPSITINTDTSPASAAISLQNQVAQYRVASQDVAQAGTALSSAQLGASEISRHLGQLQDIALRASSADLSPQERAQLNDEFSALRAKIDAIANSSDFSNSSLLNDTTSQLTAGSGDQNSVIGSLSDQALFKGANLDVSTPEGAAAASDAIKQASDYTNTQLNTIQTLQTGLDQVASGLQTAIQNQDAANSTLTDADFSAAFEVSSSASFVATDANAQAVQTNNLPSGLLQLLSE